MAPLSINIQHWPEEETQRKGPPHSARAIMVSPAVPTTPTIPRGANREGKREAVAVVASRAKPPERRREESDNYSEIFRK